MPLVPSNETPLREMVDVFVLSSVLAYSALYASPLPRAFLCITGAIALLLNAFYLHPVHLLSTSLALPLLLLPVFPDTAFGVYYSIVHAIEHTPLFVLELLVGIILVGNFVRLAILAPLAKNVRARRQVVPLQPAPLPGRGEWDRAAQEEVGTGAQPVAISMEEASEAARDALVSENVRPAAAASQPVGTDEIRNAARAVLHPSTTSARLRKGSFGTSSSAGSASTTHVQAVADSPTRKPAPRVASRRQTKSQQIATEIFQERKRERQLREDAVRRSEEAAQHAAETARLAREARQTERALLQEATREAARAVADAKQKLAEALIGADRAREARRRAADQRNLTPTEENEKALDRACEEASIKEMEESVALGGVNSTQARLVALREELRRFGSR